MTKCNSSRFIVIGLLISTINVSSVQAANNSLTGKVVEKSTSEPLEFANVVVFISSDSSQVAGATTDEFGIFKFSGLSDGNYYAQIGFIGFSTLTTPAFSLKNSALDLGVLKIEISPIALGNVEVNAEKATFNNSIDRKIYNVERDILSQTSSASDLLQNIPSVSVDVDGNISLRGAENVTIFINGKPSLLMRKNSAVVLQQMPANSIERIEVITNPSAKYKPDGVSGIINIVLKKESRPGLNGTVSASAGNQNRYNANTNLNYKLERLNLYGGYALRHRNSPRVSTSSRITRDSSRQAISYYDDNSSSGSGALAHVLNGGLDYTLNEKNQFDVSGNYFYQDSYRDQTSHTIFRDVMRQITTDFNTDRTNNEYEKEWELTSTFEHNFNKEDHLLNFELNHSGYNEEEDNLYDETYTVPDNSNALHHIQIRKGGTLTELYAEYTYPINEETEIEAGYVGEYLRDDIRYLGEDFNQQQNNWITDANKTNRFLFHQDIHALYGTFGHSFEDFSFLAGLRAEQALITSNLVSSDSTIDNDYFKLYPTLHLTYQFSDRQEIQLNYSHRVNRADSDEHNPFAEYSDPRNMEAGNPKIKPEQIHSVELGYHLKTEHFSVLPTVYYRYKYDAFTEIRQYVNDTTMLRTHTNLASDRSAGAELVVSANIKNILNLNWSADAFYQVIDATNLGYSENKSTISWNTKLAANLHLTKSNLIQLNAYHRSARLTP
ncbi:TonB-dependent receptor [bacterium]|nr:TonB-dependent receptor [bacterium]MBU1064364.1 TonB-dependent receptor [bacterium]MBU1634750.1 TonB-dependent receptor [bacterium]MBU1874455.1 TonB-dependent receptor [bacterium]